MKFVLQHGLYASVPILKVKKRIEGYHISCDNRLQCGILIAEVFYLTDGIVVIGNGIAGLSAAEAARKEDSNIPVSIISKESCPTYYRLRLCECLNDGLDTTKLNIHDTSWYKEKNIDLLLGRGVSSINVPQKRVNLDDGEEVSYSKLVIASGSKSFLPPVSGNAMENVCTIWTVNDIKKVNSYLKGARNVLVVGGGLLSLETAYRLKLNGVEATIVERNSALLHRQLDKKGSEVFEKKVLSLGVKVIKDASVKSIEGEDRAMGIRLEDGRFVKGDLIIIAAGVRPQVDFLNGTGIKVNKGIVVDKFLRTSIEDIFAAGDAAEVDGVMYGLWAAALEQGKAAGINAAKSIAHKELTEYKTKAFPYFLNSMDTKIYSIGNVNESNEGTRAGYEHIDEERYIYRKILVKDGIPKGAILMGDISNAMKIINAVKNGTPLQEDIY
jgi:nitrite reductase (NADH) large subunit